MNQACSADTINIRISCDIVLYHVILSKLYHMRTSISDVDLYFQILYKYFVTRNTLNSWKQNLLYIFLHV